MIAISGSGTNRRGQPSRSDGVRCSG